ncbi:ATP-binding protein [Sorangium sp. So ce233]|uniref:ATP-binding protein n=1 Tax=Sorangium sp. So ce233 TaxID=3133290 RepID=UPI003F615570
MAQPLSRITLLLRERKDELLREWTSRLRNDPKIPQACELNEEDLRDYTPKLLDDLIDSLARSALPGTSGGAIGQEIGSSQSAKLHAVHRLARRYTLAEELRELGALRSVIVDMCARERVPLGGEEAQLVHSTLDEVMVTAAVELERASSAELRRDVVLRELFIAILGHDLRNPLSAIRIAAASLLKREDLTAAVARLVQRIATSNERAVRMVEDMLDLTRIRNNDGLPVEPKPVDLHSICRQVIMELESSHPEHTIRLDAQGDGHGMWDPGRMGQLMSNLIGNAIDYSPPEEPVEVKLHGQKGFVVLEVNNCGIPIPPDLLPVIFDPFRRGEQQHEDLRRSKGLGLGLFIAKAIACAHGGSIHVTSTLDEGTTFRVTLPRSSSSAKRDRHAC